MPDVSLDSKKKIINQITNSGIKQVTLSGGEPIYTDNFFEVLEYMYDHKLEIILHTNGLKIDETIAQKIAPFISRISLTMDAIDPNIQIQMRKNDKITNHTINLIKIFNNFNVPVNIKTLVTKINRDEITKIGEILNDLPIKYWSLLQFISFGRGKINENNFLIDLGEFNKICTYIKNKFPSINIKIKNYNNAKNKYCFIAPDGNVYTNIKNQGDIIVGNINSEELSSLIKKIEKKL
jgi:radical S-adenosyl methionine domain-containing protein 2